jgi:alkylated DNA nucleotide flippase Atl1
VLNRFGACYEGFAFGGGDAQRLLLEGEGIVFSPDGTVDLRAYQWHI